MSKYFAPVKKSTLKYISSDGEYMKVNVQAIKGVNIPNSFNIPYVRGAVGLFNAIISRMMYFTEYDSNNNKRPYPKAQDKIYFPAWQIAPMINRCESQSYNIIRSLERILDIHVSRAHEKHGANTFRLSHRVYEFIHIYTPGKLNEFIEKYQIPSEDQYALRQLYNYRVVRPTDANLNANQRAEFHTFIKSRRHRNFLHFCSQNNKTPQARIVEIELHLDLLSEKQKEQLARIKKYLAEGITKLVNYFHWKLVDLQQYISMMLKKDKIISNESKQDSNTSNSLVNNRNKTEGEQQKTEEVAAAEKKDPEDISFQDIVQVATFWNIMSNGREMDLINSLTNKKMESIYNLVKLNGKDNVLSAIGNTGNLYKEDHMISVITFKDFIYNSEEANSRFNKVLKRTNSDTRFTDDQLRTRGDNKYKFYTNYSVVAHDNVPQFNSKAEAKSWFKSNLNQM
jgi:hypothetical protein